MIKTKKQLIKAFNDYVLSKGAILVYPSLGLSGEYSLETKFGTMTVILFDTWIALRFKDVVRATTNLGMNQYSGKWNIQGMNPKDYACIANFYMALFEQFKSKIESVI